MKCGVEILKEFVPEFTPGRHLTGGEETGEPQFARVERAEILQASEEREPLQLLTSNLSN
jgi:hypothetical protein